MEIWKSIEGFEGRYEVSNYGRVRSLDHVVSKMHKTGVMYPHTIKGRIRKFGFSGGRKGRKYPTVIITKRPLVKHCMIHRIVAIAFVPNPEGKLEVNHKDGDKLNNHYDNLEWCTRKENTQHASTARLLWDNGIHFNAKLNLKTVFKIKRELSKGIRQCEIARKYKIDPMTIQAISSGKSWKHITI